MTVSTAVSQQAPAVAGGRRRLVVAVVGATGQVGTAMLGILAERDFPLTDIRLFASARSAGRTIDYAGRQVVVEDVATAELDGIDIALFSAGASTSRVQAPRFAASTTRPPGGWTPTCH